jgi:hypothetical protein
MGSPNAGQPLLLRSVPARHGHPPRLVRRRRKRANGIRCVSVLFKTGRSPPLGAPMHSGIPWPTVLGRENNGKEVVISEALTRIALQDVQIEVVSVLAEAVCYKVGR